MRMHTANDQIDSYGTDSLNVLLDHFGRDKVVAGMSFKAMVHRDRSRLEYSTLKKLVLKEHAEAKWDPLMSSTDRCVKVWSEIEKGMAGDVPNMLFIAQSLLIAQPHCVDNERLHGLRLLIESDKRSMLRRETVDALLRVMWNSPKLYSEEAEEFYAACVRLYQSGNRRFR